MWTNIHLCTIRDFEDLCRDKKITILERQVIGRHDALAKAWPNVFAETAIYRLTRQPA